jgi:copper chaperone CopZ
MQASRTTAFLDAHAFARPQLQRVAHCAGTAMAVRPIVFRQKLQLISQPVQKLQWRRQRGVRAVSQEIEEVEGHSLLPPIVFTINVALFRNLNSAASCPERERRSMFCWAPLSLIVQYRCPGIRTDLQRFYAAIEVEVKVSGMTCEGCSSRVQKALQVSSMHEEMHFQCEVSPLTSPMLELIFMGRWLVSSVLVQTRSKQLHYVVQGLAGVDSAEVALDSGIAKIHVEAAGQLDALYTQLPRLVDAIRELGFDAEAHFGGYEDGE